MHWIRASWMIRGQVKLFFMFVILDEPVTSQELTPISAHTNLKQVVDSLVQHVISDPSLTVSCS